MTEQQIHDAMLRFYSSREPVGIAAYLGVRGAELMHGEVHRAAWHGSTQGAAFNWERMRASLVAATEKR